MVVRAARGSSLKGHFRKVVIDGVTRGLAHAHGAVVVFPSPTCLWRPTKAVFHACVYCPSRFPHCSRRSPGWGYANSSRDGLVTRIILASHAAKCADTFRCAHSPLGSSPRVYIFMGPDKMSALFGKCLGFRDFVLRMVPFL